ncbi:hypothetical protein NDN08_004532 [Rhodosorus marinus]|uniref:Right handed beta helix domain-containing protein n=1 Tax=Rhodosorus marinus TaxID=101924 RepID=A0AAV8ULJ3_9RHOD|nr:hypothetical protein NDN08_004532 [Rhodosorus marinus]
MKTFALLFALFVVGCSCHEVIELNCSRDLRTQIESAPAHSELVADPTCQWTVRKMIRVRRPVTIRGLHAKLGSGIGNVPLMSVQSEGFTMTDFEFIGNVGTVAFKDREPLIWVTRGGFSIERGIMRDSSQNGITIQPMKSHQYDIVGGVVRDLVGYSNARDLVSITGYGSGEAVARNIVAENLRAYDQIERGTIEVTDGAKDVFIRDIYAENCFYAAALQDHDEFTPDSGAHVNRVFISNVIATRCTFAIHSEAFIAGHGDITINGVVARACKNAVLLDRMNRLVLSDVKVLNGRNQSTQVDIAHAKYVTLRDIHFFGGVGRSSAITLRQVEKARVFGVTLGDDTKFKYGITVNATVGKTKAFSTLEFDSTDLEAARNQEIRYYRFYGDGS